ncbi:similar to Saccharomyces cerevisiae YOR288C MPD1 Member of the protein disulfide isomerase (PDI) family [Maudiozyma saulgeensis]|uniref:Similar to Saccharomyces cerevisiae YOR288C MPD1 Member of the protein disulfide isomerase (PDI) family n=1 Tax=Maudiozyma saulgeensis TaxID=1789683 RepID=A0A1X7R4L9_9SACH|nr:similar to Saccharomyces cerevisiae YOR288C MPD1 Member of the protein disulfide isomerase (PDI) family [Kazachstania saulgeensis]
MRLNILTRLFIWALLCEIFVNCQNFYDSDPHIIEATERNFDKIVYSTNQTSLVEFYAPWCGYCKQLKPVMHRVGKKLDGIAQVVTVNCDLDQNKGLCSKHGVEGFPTLMVFRPPKVYRKGQKHANEKYQGERTMKPIVEFVKSRVKNSVKKLRAISTIQSMLSKHHETILNNYTVILFSKVDIIPPIFKSIGIDWLSQVDFFMMHNKNIGPIDETDKIQSKFASLYPKMSKSLNDILQKQIDNKDSNRLILLDKVNDEVHIYDGKKITKLAVTKFINEITNLVPQEGPLSKRQAYIDAVKTGKKTKKAKKNHRKHAKENIKDEL